MKCPRWRCKKPGVHRLRFGDKKREKYPDFEKSTPGTRSGLSGHKRQTFLVKPYMRGSIFVGLSKLNFYGGHLQTLYNFNMRGIR